MSSLSFNFIEEYLRKVVTQMSTDAIVAELGEITVVVLVKEVVGGEVVVGKLMRTTLYLRSRLCLSTSN